MGLILDLCNEFRDQRALPYARLATHEDYAPAGRVEIVQELTELRQFRVSLQNPGAIITAAGASRFDARNGTMPVGPSGAGSACGDFAEAHSGHAHLENARCSGVGEPTRTSTSEPQ